MTENRAELLKLCDKVIKRFLDASGRPEQWNEFLRDAELLAYALRTRIQHDAAGLTGAAYSIVLNCIKEEVAQVHTYIQQERLAKSIIDRLTGLTGTEPTPPTPDHLLQTR